MMYESLRLFGLNDTEIEMYSLIAEAKKLRVRNILEKVKLNRSVVYATLNTLEKKGFCTKERRNNITYFKAIDTTTLLKRYKENEKRLREELELLTKRSSKIEDKPNIQILQGHSGIITLMNEIIESKEENLVIGEVRKYNQTIEMYNNQFRNALSQSGMKERLLISFEDKNTKGSKNSQVRFLPKGFRFPTSTLVYGKKVVIAFWYDPVVFLCIQDKNIAVSYRNSFEILWNLSRKRTEK